MADIHVSRPAILQDCSRETGPSPGLSSEQEQAHIYRLACNPGASALLACR